MLTVLVSISFLRAEHLFGWKIYCLGLGSAQGRTASRRTLAQALYRIRHRVAGRNRLCFFDRRRLVRDSAASGFEGYIPESRRQKFGSDDGKGEEFVAVANDARVGQCPHHFLGQHAAVPGDLIVKRQESSMCRSIAIYAVMQSTFGNLYVNDFTYMGRNSG